MTITRMAVAIWLTAAVSHGHEPAPRITICIRYGVNDRLVIGPLAEYLATRMFAEGGISVTWKAHESDRGGSQPPIVIEVVGESPPEVVPGVLAYSNLCRGRITVFLDRIEKLENQAIVLAHVLVHEITHVAEGINRHSDSGVMKAHWTGRDFAEMRLRPLGFAPEDLQLIRQGLSRRASVGGAPGLYQEIVQSDSAGR
jgi:hypothetical protein